MWIKKFIDDCIVWRKVRILFKKNKDKLNKLGYKMDWIGRIYYIINREQEIPIGSKGDGLLMTTEIQNFEKELGIYGLTPYLNIKFVPIVSDTENSYVVVFTPSATPKHYLKLWHFYAFPILLLMIIVCVLVYFL